MRTLPPRRGAGATPPVARGTAVPGCGAGRGLPFLAPGHRQGAGWAWPSVARAGLALLASLLLLPAAQAQSPGCGFGLGLAALRAADSALAEGSQAGSLSAGRAAGAAAVAPLREAVARLAGCGCRQLGEFAGEALGLAEQAESEASLARLRATLERARFSLGLLRERAGRQGCG